MTDQQLNLTTGQAIAAMAGTLLFALYGLIIQTTGFVGLGWLMAFALLISFYPLTFVIHEHHMPEKGDHRTPALQATPTIGNIRGELGEPKC